MPSSAAILALSLAAVGAGKPPLSLTPPPISLISVRGAARLGADRVSELAGLKIGQPLTDAAVRQARAKLESSGWFGAREKEAFAAGVKISAERSTGTVRIEVDENPLIRWIEIQDSGPFSEKDVISSLRTKSGEILNWKHLRADEEQMDRRYSQAGYKAFVQSVLLSDGVLRFDPGLARIRSIRIRGLTRAREQEALASMKAKPGSYYNLNTLQSDYTRLYENGFGTDLSVSVVETQRGWIDVTLTLEGGR